MTNVTDFCLQKPLQIPCDFEIIVSFISYICYLVKPETNMQEQRPLGRLCICHGRRVTYIIRSIGIFLLPGLVMLSGFQPGKLIPTLNPA